MNKRKHMYNSPLLDDDAGEGIAVLIDKAEAHWRVFLAERFPYRKLEWCAFIAMCVSGFCSVLVEYLRHRVIAPKMLIGADSIFFWAFFFTLLISITLVIYCELYKTVIRNKFNDEFPKEARLIRIDYN